MRPATINFNKKTYYRNGESHRDGADVSFGDIVKIFGFKSAKVGNWVTKSEQQIAANLFFDAFCDLADILKLPCKTISLRGTLSIAYGTGGRKSAKAHYNVATRTLSLAKKAGGGALAHEWFHAFDHYLANKMFEFTGTHGFASEIWLNNLAEITPHPLNKAMEAVFKAIFVGENGPSTLVNKSLMVDKELHTFYYARPQEVVARVFERCIQGHTIKNSFLVAGTKESNEAKLGLYPNSELTEIFWRLFAYYFQHLGRAMEAQKPVDTVFV